jgi:sulfoxide reductase heme-binding subunit YedZ
MSSKLEGWNLTAIAAIAIAVVTAAIVVGGGTTAPAFAAAVRFTARTSFALFTAAFTASALYRLRPNRMTRWQLRNRRYLGVAFAASHATHAAAFIALGTLRPVAIQLPGVVAYAFIVAMTATSFDRTAAWIGARAWKILHVLGSLVVWGGFVRAFGVRAIRAPAYWLPVAIALAAMAVRIAAWLRGWRARRVRTRAALIAALVATMFAVPAYADGPPEPRPAAEVNVLWPFLGISEFKAIVPLYGNERFGGELVAGVYLDYAQAIGGRPNDPGKVWLLGSLVGFRQFFAYGIHAEVSVLTGVRHESNYEDEMITLNDFYVRAFPMVGWQRDVSSRFYVNARVGAGVLIYRETHEAQEVKVLDIADVNVGARF